MNCWLNHAFWIRFLALFTLLVSVAPAVGQNDDPFGEEPAATEGTEPEGDAPAATEIDLTQYGPAIRTVMEAKRETPDEYLQGVLLLLDLGEPDLAKRLFERVAAAEIDDVGKAAIARKLGSDRMMRLARANELGPDAAALADACMAALAAEVRDPARLEGLVEQLADPAREVRHAAIVDLVEAGQAGATFCVQSLLSAAATDPISIEHVHGLQSALVEFGPLATQPLIAALATENPNAKAAVIRALAAVDPASATLYLVAPAMVDSNDAVRQAAAASLVQANGRLPEQSEAVTALARSVESYFEGRLPSSPDEDGLVTIWTLAPATDGGAARELVATRVSPKDASISAASQLAADLAALAPQSVEYRTLALLCKLHAAKLVVGLDAPLDASGVFSSDAVDVAALDRALGEALRRGSVPAAIAAAELLGERGDPAAIYGHAPSAAPLVEALRHGDRRLRFAALEAISKINPSQPFPGASRVTEALEYFLRGAERRAIVAMPDLQRAQMIAGWLRAEGLEPIPVDSGRVAVAAALDSGDAEVIFLDAEIGQPTIREVLYQLRSSPKTSRVPVALLAGPRSFDHGAQVAAGDAWTKSFARPQDAAATKAIHDAMFELAGRSYVAPELREKQAAAALGWVAEAMENGNAFYELRRLEPVVLSATFAPNLAETAIVALGRFGSAESQRTLIEIASRQTEPVERRQAAADAFRQSVGRFGIQLTREELLRQYDRYNASEHADKATQQVLGHVLDTLERRTGDKP